MAGYTSRFFLTLTIPSVFGFLSVLWFLKRKNPSKSTNKAIQVENSAELEFEKQFLTLDPMKLKNQQEESCEGNVSSEMRLKETQNPESPTANGVQQNGKAKSKKKKSKIRENGSTLPKDYILEDSDRQSSLEDNGIDLSNGVEAIDLNATDISAKDELLNNTINRTHSDMEIATNGTNSSNAGVHVNGDSEKLTVSDTHNLSIQQNGESAKEQCDTDVEISTEERNSASDESQSEQSYLSPDLPIDSHNSLTLPVDTTETSGEMLESPGATYCDSVGSFDSGRGPSEIHFDSYQVQATAATFIYEFDILQEFVGLLIGKNGKHIRTIKEQTNASVLVKRHPFFELKKVCAVSGTENEIHAALKLIRKRFPVEKFPTVTLAQICPFPNDYQVPDVVQLSLPQGVSFDAMLCATVTAGHFFLQQPTHPTFHSLPFLSNQMTAHYNDSNYDAPLIPPQLLSTGNVCTANLLNAWYRAEIVEVYEGGEECKVKFLDYGAFSVLPTSSLRQIRTDFMNLPFQATECYLGGVIPADGSEWSREATLAFEELAMNQIIQGFIMTYSENKVPFVKLFKITGVNMIDINEELVRKGFAKPLPAIQQ